MNALALRSRWGQLGDGPNDIFDPWFTPAGIDPSTGLYTGSGQIAQNGGISTPSSSGGVDFSHYFNTVASLVSQFLGSRGRYQTTQLGPAGSPIITPAAQVAAAYSQPTYGSQYGSLTAEQAAALRAQQGTLGGGIGSGINGLINWATANPVPVFLIIGGAFLLFREPPRSRR